MKPTLGRRKSIYSCHDLRQRGTFLLGSEYRPLGSEAPMQVLLPGFMKTPIKVLLPFTTLPTFYKLLAVGFRNPTCGYTTYPMCKCWSLYKVSLENLQVIIDMLEILIFLQLLLHQLCGTLKIYKIKNSASQLGTFRIRVGMCPTTLNTCHNSYYLMNHYTKYCSQSHVVFCVIV